MKLSCILNHGLLVNKIPTKKVKMQNFESSEYSVNHNKNQNQQVNAHIDIENIQLAEIELDEDLIFAAHRS